MRILIIGAGRMGLRHAIGVLKVKGIESITVADINEYVLFQAENHLIKDAEGKKISYCLIENINEQFEIVIIATTAQGRFKTIECALSVQPKYLLIEKPLGQSFQEVENLIALMEDKNVHTFVNLNMRMYAFVKKLKNDLDNLPQFQGTKTICYNGGSLGIGANGIHYLDLLLYLFGADKAELVNAEIDPFLIPSGRGPSFGDFGGWCCIKYYNQGIYLGKSLISLSSESTVFGGWDIIGSHGRIRINETEGERVDILRNLESQMPVNRYAADYLIPVVTKIESPFLGDLTCEWIEGLQKGKFLLPDLQNTLKVHKLMFDWLSHSKTYQSIFPIT